METIVLETYYPDLFISISTIGTFNLKFKHLHILILVIPPLIKGWD